MAAEEVEIQVWEGYVASLSEDGFTARLVNVTAGDRHEGEEAEIPWGSLPEGRPPGIREGTYLRWRILGRADANPRSEFAFDIAGTWTAEELERAKARGAELSAGLAACFQKGEPEERGRPGGTGSDPA